MNSKEHISDEKGITPTPDGANHGSPIVTTGLNNLGQTGIVCKWEYHALAEYMDSDTKLSHELLGRFALAIEKLGISGCQLKISDRYPDEPEKDPHYLLGATFGSDHDLNEILGVSIGYKSLDASQPAAGTIKVQMALPSSFTGNPFDLLTGFFAEYDEMMFNYYPDPPIGYDDSGLQIA